MATVQRFYKRQFLQNGVTIVNGKGRDGPPDAAAQQSRETAHRSRKRVAFIFPAAADRGTAANTASTESQHDIDATTQDFGSLQIAGWKRLLDHTSIWLSFALADGHGYGRHMDSSASPGPLYRQERWLPRTPLHDLEVQNDEVNVETQTTRVFERLMQADCPMTKLTAEIDGLSAAGVFFVRSADELPQIFNVFAER
jgi:hypothetical protein